MIPFLQDISVSLPHWYRICDGTDDYIGITEPIAPYTPFTFACYAYAENFTTDRCIMCSSYSVSSSSQDYWGLWFNTSSRLMIQNASTFSSSFQGATTLSANTWYHVAGIWYSSSSQALFVNGVRDATGSLTTNPTTTPQRFQVSGNKFTNNPLRGGVAMPAVWNRSLSLGEVQKLAWGEHPLNMGCDWVWDFEPRGTTLIEFPKSAVQGRSPFGLNVVNGPTIRLFNSTAAGVTAGLGKVASSIKSLRQWNAFDTAAAPSTSVPVFVHHYRMQGIA